MSFVFCVINAPDEVLLDIYHPEIVLFGLDG